MKQTELLTTQLNAEETKADSKTLYKREQIENSPFWIIGNKEKGYNITMGKYKITQEPLPSELDARIWLEEHKWDVTLTIALCAYTDMRYRSEDTNK
jgi:protein-disulfide isomerase-like protein with CxxC motif